MKRGRMKILWALLLCVMVPFCAGAEGLEMATPLQGELIHPQGATEDTATYVFRYELPQFVAGTEAEKAVNAYYRAMFDDLSAMVSLDSAIETVGAEGEGLPVMRTSIGYQVTAMTDAYISVNLTTTQFFGYVESETLMANVFARDGLYAGQPVTLSQVMGMEQEGDEFSTEASYASKLSYKLVWKIIQEQEASLEKDYFEGLTQQDLEAAFDPETDFYIDMDENLVFYVQSGTIAGEVEGLLTYPFSMAELLSAVKE